MVLYDSNISSGWQLETLFYFPEGGTIEQVLAWQPEKVGSVCVGIKKKKLAAEGGVGLAPEV